MSETASAKSAGQSYHLNNQQTTNQRPININNQTLPSSSGLQNNSSNQNTNTFLHSIVQDYLLSPVLSHLTTTASIFGQQSEFHQPKQSESLPPTPPTSPGSYPPSGSDKLYEILYRSSRKLFGAPSMAFDCVHHSSTHQSSVKKSFEEASQLLASLALDNSSNLCAQPSRAAHHSSDSSNHQESNMLNKILLFFMPAMSTAEHSVDSPMMNSTRSRSPTMDGSSNYLRSSSVPIIKSSSGFHSTSSIPATISAASDALPSFPALMKQCPRASQLLNGEVTGPAHHVISDVLTEQLRGFFQKSKRSRSMSEADFASIRNDQNRSMAANESPQMARFSPNLHHSTVHSDGEESHSSDDDQAADYQQEVSGSPTTQQQNFLLQSWNSTACDDLTLSKHLCGGKTCQPADNEPSVDATTIKEPEVQESKVLQQDRQRRKEKKNKNRRRRTRKAKNKSSSDESDFSKSSECDDSSESSDELLHYQLSTSPKTKKSYANKGRGKKRIKSAANNNANQAFYAIDDDDDDDICVFTFEDSDSNDDVKDSYDPGERRLSHLFAPPALMFSSLLGCTSGASTSRNQPTTSNTNTACDTISSHDNDGQNRQKPKCLIQSSLKGLFQTIQVQCQPFTRGLCVASSSSQQQSDHPTTATPNNTPVSQVIAIPANVVVYDDDEDDEDYRHPLLNIGSASPDQGSMLTEDDIRRNQKAAEECAAEEERIRVMVADANRRWDEAMNQEQTVPETTTPATKEDEDQMFDLDDVDSVPSCSPSPSINKKAKKSKDRTIHFSADPPQVFLIDLTEEEAAISHEVRSNYWVTEAVDRLRKQKTHTDLLSVVLSPEHRARIYRERFQEQPEEDQEKDQQQPKEDQQNNVAQ